MKKDNYFTLAVIGLQVCLISPVAYGRVRSEAAKNVFKHSNPCPSNGRNHGPCPGYVIDHISPLACNGVDGPSNMQWQSVADGKAKDKWERKDCQLSRSIPAQRTQVSAYFTGSKGGCYTYTSGVKKHYVDRSFCLN